jgi:hypothetical protein
MILPRSTGRGSLRRKWLKWLAGVAFAGLTLRPRQVAAVTGKDQESEKVHTLRS